MTTDQTIAHGQPGSAPLLTIGELARRTGLSPEVLRTWETRHGFPVPTRLPRGHRRYTEDDVRAVQRVVGERDKGVRLERAILQARATDVDVADTGSVFAALSARHPTLSSYTLTKRTLLALSWAIEDECLAVADRAAMIGTFQRQRYFAESARRWTDVARTARDAVVMADFGDHDDDASPARVALPPDSPLLREWIVVCDGPGLGAALVAWEFPGQDVPESQRHFESVWSVEGPVVRDALVLTARAGADLGSGACRSLLDGLETAPPPPDPASARTATSVFNRMVAYTDGSVLRGRRSS